MTAPPDIFLSYNREDQAVARRFAEAFQREGFSVWWDATLRSGEAYDQVTERALKTAKAVVVLWSTRSVESRWVRAEATLADRNKTLVPAMIEPCDRPIMFELTQTADLSRWDGSPMNEAWRAFVADVKRFVEASVSLAPGSSPSRSPALPESLASSRSAAQSMSVAPPSDKVSICVLPFANMSKDDEQEYFADGISEDIITDLSKVSALIVISRNSAFAFKGKQVDLRQLARQLEVTHVLEGSVRKSGNRVRITAQLIEAARDSHVWAERYDRDLSDIFALQDEISQAIVSALRHKLFPEEKRAIEDRGTMNVEAYDKYLRARALLHHQGPAELRRAMQILREALALDPEFTLAWRGLYQAHRDASMVVAESSEQAQMGMTEAAARMLALAPNAWWSHELRVNQFYDQRRWAEAEAAAAAALAGAPSSEVEPIWTYCILLSAVGRPEEAVQYAARVRQIEPLSLRTSAELQVQLDLSGRAAEAEAEYERSKDLPGDRQVVENFALLRALGSGDAEAVRNSVRRYMACDTAPVAGLEGLPEMFDQPQTMLARLRQAAVNPANQDSRRQLRIALWGASYGDIDRAVSALRRFALDLRSPRLGVIWVRTLSGARRTPAFKEFLRELGLVDYWRQTGKWGEFVRPVGDDDFEVIR
jgi:TolB-like protein